MKQTNPKARRRHPVRWFIIIVLIIAALTVGGVYAWHWHKNHNQAKTTSTSTTAQSNYKSGGSRPNGGSSSTTQGGANDNNGASSGSTGTGSGTSSTSGQITVNLPASGATMQTGQELSGTAKVSQVSFRLVSAKVGVVAQGTLNVVNDAFSGTLHYDAAGTAGDGKLVVYSLDNSGVEINSVTVPVQFKE
jgi:hypothetical protein